MALTPRDLSILLGNRCPLFVRSIDAIEDMTLCQRGLVVDLLVELLADKGLDSDGSANQTGVAAESFIDLIYCQDLDA